MKTYFNQYVSSFIYTNFGQETMLNDENAFNFFYLKDKGIFDDILYVKTVIFSKTHKAFSSYNKFLDKSWIYDTKYILRSPISGADSGGIPVYR